MSIEIQREGAVAFAVPLPRSLLRDARLTFGARGLFAFLWDLPEGWVLRLGHLVKMGPEGRDALRARLRELEQVGAVRIEAIRADGGRVAGKRWILIAANRWAIEAPLARESLQDEDFTEERVFRSSVKPIIGKPDAKVLQGFKVLQEEAARAPAQNTNSAAAINCTDEKRRHPLRSQNGIECWYPSEDSLADSIEESALPEQIAGAVTAIKARKNSAGKPQSPVPALVAKELERQHHEQEAAERRAATAQHVAVVDALIDPLAAARGEQILADIRRKSKTQSEVTTHD